MCRRTDTLQLLTAAIEPNQLREGIDNATPVCQHTVLRNGKISDSEAFVIAQIFRDRHGFAGQSQLLVVERLSD
jgi:hypothetical protein